MGGVVRADGDCVLDERDMEYGARASQIGNGVAVWTATLVGDTFSDIQGLGWLAGLQRSRQRGSE